MDVCELLSSLKIIILFSINSIVLAINFFMQKYIGPMALETRKFILSIEIIWEKML
jgi:hypothetical protein